MKARARLIAVLLMVAGGAIALISATQSWYDVPMGGTADDALHVTGSSAIPVLVPMSLAAIAAGVALSIAGRVFRYVLAVIAIAIGVGMLVLNVNVALNLGIDQVSSAVTEVTGIAGNETIATMIDGMVATPWVFVTIVAWILLLLAGILVLLTASSWQTAGRRYRTTGVNHADNESGPLDKIDSWDALSHGDDPTETSDKPTR